MLRFKKRRRLELLERRMNYGVLENLKLKEHIEGKRSVIQQEVKLLTIAEHEQGGRLNSQALVENHDHPLSEGTRHIKSV